MFLANCVQCSEVVGGAETEGNSLPSLLCVNSAEVKYAHSAHNLAHWKKIRRMAMYGNPMQCNVWDTIYVSRLSRLCNAVGNMEFNALTGMQCV